MHFTIVATMEETFMAKVTIFFIPYILLQALFALKMLKLK